jgi:RHS repeat-associated protein
MAHSYYHADGNGNVTMLINASQTMAAKYLYDAFGNTLAQSGYLAAANTYRFSSKEWNANSGLYYYLCRFYDPNLQRWVNEDPIGEFGGIDLYEFCENSPIDKDDEFGHQLIFSPPVELPPVELSPIELGPIELEPIPVPLPVPKPTPPTPPIPPIVPPQCDGNPPPDDCAQQWAEAKKACADELAKPHPSRKFTGGHNDVDGCAKGHVSEGCGGNPVDHGKPPKKRIRRVFPTNPIDLAFILSNETQFEKQFEKSYQFGLC